MYQITDYTYRQAKKLRVDVKPSTDKKKKIDLCSGDDEKIIESLCVQFDIDIIVFNDSAEAKLMTRYTGGEVHKRTAYLAVNMCGGGGFEIWQYTSRVAQPSSLPITLNSPGIVAIKMKTFDIEKSLAFMIAKKVTIFQPIKTDVKGKRHFWVKDPYNNLFQIVEDDFWFVHPSENSSNTGGVAGAVIVVSNMEASLKFYKEVLNYGEVVYDESGLFDDLQHIPGGNGQLRRALLTQDIPVKGPFSRMLGPSYVELIETPLSASTPSIFKDRYWGDLGFIHLCYDITDMQIHENLCNKFGYPLTVNGTISNSNGTNGIIMTDAMRVTYFQDPTLDNHVAKFSQTA
jgi:catechol 2,3-dioxygenase-like lactoylglutathione lyase family enzyme